MKSKSISSFLAGLFLVALAVAVAPRSAMAVGDEIGKFTLPVEVHWGAAVLPAGAYSLMASDHSTTSMMCVYKQGSPNLGYFIPAQELVTIPTSMQKTQLVLDEKNGTIYVMELQLGGEGLEYHYSAPKLKK
jgi:hypothetical protein